MATIVARKKSHTLGTVDPKQQKKCHEKRKLYIFNRCIIIDFGMVTLLCSFYFITSKYINMHEMPIFTKREC
jgi:hypothetical protein